MSSDDEDFPDSISLMSSTYEEEKKEDVLKKDVKEKQQFSKKELQAVDFQGALAMFLFEDKKTLCFAARIKHVKDLDLNKTFDQFDKDTKYSVVVVAEEGSGYDLHHHLILRGKELTRTKITEDIKKVYPDCRGNKCFSISEARDQKQLLKYTLKEGEYLARGIPGKILELAHQLSNPKTDLKKKIIDNEEAVLLGKITLLDFVDRYLEIKVQHSQAIYPSHVTAYVTRIGMAAGLVERRDYARSIIEKINPN